MSWVAGASLEELSMLLHDCEAVAGVLASWLLPALQPLLGPVVPPPVLEAMGEALQVRNRDFTMDAGSLLRMLQVISADKQSECKVCSLIAQQAQQSSTGKPSQ